MTASRTGSVEAVRLLAAHGADLNAREHTRGQTALMWAVAQQHPHVVEALIALGADVHAPLGPAAAAHPYADRRVQPQRGDRHRAGRQHAPPVRGPAGRPRGCPRHLVAAGADVNDTAATGTSALVVAAHSGHTTLALFLLEHGADPHAAEAGYSALHAAALRGDETLAAALLARGADPNAPVVRGSQGRRNSPDYVLQHDVVGATAFWLAAHFAEPGVMRALADGGADPRFVMENGTTPLMAAVAARRRREPGLAPNPAEDERLVLEAAQGGDRRGGRRQRGGLGRQHGPAHRSQATPRHGCPVAGPQRRRPACRERQRADALGFGRRARRRGQQHRRAAASPRDPAVALSLAGPRVGLRTNSTGLRLHGAARVGLRTNSAGLRLHGAARVGLRTNSAGLRLHGAAVESRYG